MKIGIDIGGSHIATGMALESGKLIEKETIDIQNFKMNNEKESEDIIINSIGKEIKNLLDKYDYTEADISKIGIAVPGTPTETNIRNIVNLNIKDFNIAKILQQKYNTKITIKNDGKCAGIAEKKYGSLRKYDDCIFLCIGTGVGSAVFINGELIKPQNNPGFEFGHMIIDKNGTKCNCGNNGCFETFASMKRFKNNCINQFNLPENMKSIDFQNYIRQNMKNNSKIQNAVDNYLENVAIGISNIINIFEPQAISFGGSFSYYEDIFIPILSTKIEKYIFNKPTKTKLISAMLKNDAGIIGAME